VDRIVAAAIAIADAEGLDRLSMRRVADHLGVGTMSLYRYVPGKTELLDVMVDRVNGEAARQRPLPDDPPSARAGWRARLERVARENRRLYERHPWLLQIFPGRPPLGPGIMAKYEHELSAVEGISLTDVEMDSVLTLVLEYVRGSSSSAVESAQAPAHTGQTDDQWWTAFAPLVEKVFDPARYPVAARVGPTATEHYQGAYDPRHAFEFGLDRLLDGIEVFVEKGARIS
jgi:AcrR family transcriptional regulator